MDATITGDSPARERPGTRMATRLVFLGDADDPRAPSSSHGLDGIDEVRFGRGPRNAERRGRALVLSVPDGRMSSAHGALQRDGSRWVLDDPSSKNAAVVDGEVMRRAVIGDGALIELGRSFFLFRRSVLDREVPAHLAGDVDALHLPAWPAGMATFSPALANELATLVRLADKPLPLVLTGETGTGKEVIAGAIHALANRPGAFVAVNCGGLPQTLIEAELFGHKKGAFTGAAAERRGLVRSADGGTLFLDEIGELPVAVQATLLRVLQEREVLPVGDDRPVAVDFRLIAATLRDLEAAIAAGAFRADLYARLVGHVTVLPPLRERREDFGLLIAALLPRVGGTGIRFAPAALRALIRHDWPRNIRELEQCLAKAVALAPDGVIDVAHLPPALQAPRPTPSDEPDEPDEPARPVKLDELGDADRALRAELIARFEAHDGNVVAVAEAMGKQRQQIYKWIKRLGIDLSRFRRST